MKGTLTFLLAAITNLVSAQTFHGIVYDADTKEPIPFVSIGILHKSQGTVAQLDGSYSITINELYDNDTLKISIIGYTPKIFIVKNFKQQYPSGEANIYLQQQMEDLNAVVIRPRELKEVQLGNDFNSPSIIAGFKSDSLGSEIGTIMKVKDGRKYYLKTAGINIGACRYDSITFRINIYDFEDGTPGALLPTRPIYATVKKDQRSLVIDLEPYDIVVDNDFILSIEWVEDLPDKTTAFMLCAGLIGNRIFYKQVSQDDWRSFPVAVGMYCVAEYEK